MSAINGVAGKKVERKYLITVAEWIGDGKGTITGMSGDPSDTTKYYREVLGARTEDSSIELNPDTETVTDILGNTYTDVNKTEPQQDFDPYFVLSGSELSGYLVEKMLENDINAYNNSFNIYIITGFIGEEGKFNCVKHKACTILPTSLGGDAYIAMPIEVHLSNKIEKGTVDKLANDFTFDLIKDLTIA